MKRRSKENRINMSVEQEELIAWNDIFAYVVCTYIREKNMNIITNNRNESDSLC